MARSIDELARLVAYHQDLYYNSQPEISDAEFDQLYDELKQRAPEHAVVQRVGPDAASGFPKRRHLMPMGSQDKASSPEQFLKWARRVAHPRYIVQYKLDGASMELQYRDGRFTHGVTRGDGQTGDDITANVRRMRGVVPELPDQFTGAVRGEVIMEHAVHQEHYPDKANCRNAANGVMKRKDGVGAELLLVMCYDAHVDGDTTPFEDEISKLEWIASCGFTMVPWRVFDDPEEIIAYRDQVTEDRAALDFDIDGLVVKGPEIDWADMQRARPQKQIAFKFSAEEALSVLRDVEWSPSGHLYTPVAMLDPVALAGTTVRRASLVHPELIAEMGLRINSEVIVSKRGDIIPKIERLVRHLDDNRMIDVPEHCETCGATLVNEGKRLYCPNLRCPKRDYHRVRKWLDTLEIRDFGDALLGKLFDAGMVREIADLYALAWEQLASFEGVGEVSARKVLGNLHAVDEVPLARFIAGFDIFGIAELKVQKLVDGGFTSLEELRSAAVEELAACDGIADTTARQISQGLHEVADKMDAVLATGSVRISSTGTAERTQPLAGLSFCFTGTLATMKRSDAERLVRELGGEARSSVSGALSYLVTNEPEASSSKLRKARDARVSVISEDEFLLMAGLGHGDSA